MRYFETAQPFTSGHPNSILIIGHFTGLTYLTSLVCVCVCVCVCRSGVSQLHVHMFRYKLWTAKSILQCGKDTDPRHIIVSIAITTPKNGKP